MLNNRLSLYQHSGKFTPYGPVLGLLAGAIVALPLAYGYAFAIAYIPFIYINFIITGLFAFIIGGATMLAIQSGKIRNRLIAIGTSLLVACVALYAMWTAHIYATFDDAPAFCSPDYLFMAIGHLYEHGSWSLKSTPVTGIILAIVWLAEAAITSGLIVYLGYTGMANTPFCETTQTWLSVETDIDTLAFIRSDEAQLDLQSGDLSCLTKPRPRNINSSTFCRITIKSSQDEEAMRTVRLTNITITQDKNGNDSEQKDELTGDLIIEDENTFNFINQLADLKPLNPAKKSSRANQRAANSDDQKPNSLQEGAAAPA